MAVTRRVSVRIALDGYDEYRNNIRKINEQNKILESELRVIDSSYRDNAGSVEHLAERQKNLIERYNNEIDKLNQLKAAREYANKKVQEYSDAVAVAQKKVDEETKAIDALEKELKTHQEILDNATNSGRANATQIQKQKDYIEELNQKILAHKTALNQDMDELNKSQAYLNTAEGEVNKLTTEINNQQVTIDNVSEAIRNNQKAMSDSRPFFEKFAEGLSKVGESFQAVSNMAQPIANVLQQSVDSAVNFEDSFANVSKTFTGTDEQLQQLNEDIKEMSTRVPVSTSELNNLASIAGQLGVKAEDISTFTEIVAGLGEATNITSEEAGKLMAQFNNITNFTEGYGAEGYERFASTIVHLGNNSATTEKDIMNMAQRFASAGTLAGLNAPEILGMATALSSVGIASESGGTSLTKLTQKIQSAVETSDMSLEEFAKKNNTTIEGARKEWEELQKPLQDFAEVAGVSADEFSRKWKESPVEAINMFLGGLNKTYKEGGSVMKLLDELGFNEVRLRNAASALATSEKDLGYYVGLANQAWDKNSALQTEVGRKYDTVASKQKMLKNSIELARIEIGEALLPVMAQIVTTARDIIVPIAEWIDKNPELVQAIASAVAVLLSLNSAIQFAINLTSIITALSNPLTLAIAGITAGLGMAVFAILKIKDSLGPTARSMEEFRTVTEDTQEVIDEINLSFDKQNQVTDETASKAEDLVERLSELESQGLDSEEAQAEYNKTVSELNQLIPDLNLKIDEETGKVEGGTAAVLKNIDAWKKSARVRAYQDKYQKLIEKQIELEEEAEKLNSERTALESKLASQRIQIASKETEAKHILWEMQQNDLKGLSGANVELQERLQQIYDEDIPALERDINRTTQEIDNCTKAIEQNGKEQDNVQTQLDETSEKMDGVANSADKIYKNVDDVIKQGKKNWGKDGEEVFTVMINGMQHTIDTKRITFDEFKKRIKDGFYVNTQLIGEDYITGLINGMRKQNRALANQANASARGVTTAVRNTWSINSPSKVAEKDADYLMQGYIIGMEKNKEKMENTMKEIATDSTDAYNKAVEKADDSINHSGLLDFDDINGNVKSSVEIRQDNETRYMLDTMANLMRKYLPQMSNMQVVMDGNKLVGTLAPKLDNYYANEQFANERGM